MQIYCSIKDLRQALEHVRSSGRNIGLVPTMGNLHDGHSSLVKMARQDSDFTLTSIFVNPTQFGPNEDFQNYPRSFEQDIAALEALGNDAVFYPDVSEMYPNGASLETTVSVPELSNTLCGASRPGHFDGVCTIVSKLFNICQPDRAYFGEKDYQQLAIIKTLVADLNMPLEIISVPTVRESSGLAMSSRNNYLNATQKEQAVILYKMLQKTASSIEQEVNPDFSALEQNAQANIANAGLQPDYFSICQARTLKPAQPGDRNLIILTAAYLDKTRLIDNIAVKLI